MRPAAATAALVVVSIFTLSCGNDRAIRMNDGSMPDANDAMNAADADDVVDAGPEAWAGCYREPYSMVVCPDADFFITVVGDGPTQVLRSNDWGVYRVPIAAYQPPGGELAPSHMVLGKDAPDGGVGIAISHDSNTCYDRNGARYCAQVVSDSNFAEVKYTRADEPGGVVAGTYTVLVKNSNDAGTLSLSGEFFACRICDLPTL